MSVDIGELRNEIERSLAEADAAWWEWDRVHDRVTFNDKKVTALGYGTSEFENVGYQAFTALLHPDDYERTMDAMRRHLRGEAPLYQIDYRIQRADGAYTWYMDRGYTVESSPDGSSVVIRGVVFDLGLQYETGDYGETLVRLIREVLPAPGERLAESTIAVVCMVCRRLKLPDGNWAPVSDRLPQILPGRVSHGLCDECIDIMYPEYRRILERRQE